MRGGDEGDEGAQGHLVGGEAGRVSGAWAEGQTGGSAEVSKGSAAASMWPRLHYHLQLASSS